MRRRGYFNSHHIYQRTARPDESIPFDWPAFQASDTTMRIGAFCCDTGEQVCWGREDMPCLEDLTSRCQASSMPPLMPSVRIDGVDYLDGALGPTGGFATDAARADGWERMLAVTTRPAGYRKPAVAQAIIDRPAHYKRTLAELEQAPRRGQIYLYRPRYMPIVNGELRYDRVASAYEAGLVQAREELPRIARFLGL